MPKICVDSVTAAVNWLKRNGYLRGGKVTRKGRKYKPKAKSRKQKSRRKGRR